MSDVAFLLVRCFRVPRLYFGKGIGLQAVDKVVGLDAEAFAAAHLYKRTFSVLVRKLKAKLLSRGW